MGILGPEYYLTLYYEKIAEQCKTLEEAIKLYCPECDRGREIIKFYVLKHEADANFEDQVDRLSFVKTCILLESLYITGYGIFTPWFKRAVISILTEPFDALTQHEQGYFRQISQLYNYYIKAFDEVNERDLD